MESRHTPNAGQELASAEASSEQSKEDRAKTFSRRALLQWSLPLAAAGVAAFLPLTAQGQHGDSYTDTPCDDSHNNVHVGSNNRADNHDHHSDNATHCDGAYCDHSDHDDGHDDYPNPASNCYHDDYTDHGDASYVNHTDHSDVPHGDAEHSDYNAHSDTVVPHTTAAHTDGTDVAHTDANTDASHTDVEYDDHDDHSDATHSDVTHGDNYWHDDNDHDDYNDHGDGTHIDSPADNDHSDVGE